MPTALPAASVATGAPAARRRTSLVLLALYLLCWAAALLGSALDHAATDRALNDALDARNIAEALRLSTERGSAAERFAWSLLAGLALPLLAAAMALPVLAWRSDARRSATSATATDQTAPRRAAQAC